MSDVIFRTLNMLRYIPRYPRSITADRLRHKMEQLGYPISLRSVQRDLGNLSGQFPLIDSLGEDNKTKQWSWTEDAPNMDLPDMSTTTAFSFHLVEQFLKNLLPESVQNSLTPYFKSAQAVLQSIDSQNWTRGFEHIRVIPQGQALIPASIDSEMFEAIFEALLSHHRFDAVYLNRNNERKECVINPLGLVFRQETSYLVATFWEYQDIRQLALHRFLSVTPRKDDPQTIPPQFHLDDYIHQKHFGYRVSDHNIQLKALFTPESCYHLHETPLSHSQTLIERSDGRFLLSAEIEDTQSLRWWLLGFGSYVEIVEPAALRAEFAAIAKGMAKHYT